MALHSEHFAVYVALYFVSLVFFRCNVGASGSVFNHLQPYDFLYYSGVRAYYGEEWGKAAELLEKSIATKESLLRVRRLCHDECVAAGADASGKLGE